MIEKIGNVILDYSKYPGQDFYCDGKIEDEILDIVKTYPASEYHRVIQERKSWPVLYHLSPLRENIVDWLPINKEHKVLEVGSGCGAITGALADKAGTLTCVDLSKKRSLINAYRHSDCDNVRIHVGNFKDIEPTLTADYDYICLIGVFEYGQSYIGGETPYEDFLKILLKHLKKDGRIIIAIENKYGLKYFAGCKEDHLGTYFGGIENYVSKAGVKTFGRKGLEKIFEACGVTEYHFYYPYPDYKFMTTLFSDGYLPHKGELVNNLRNFDRDRMLLFQEKDAFDGLLEEELFPVFSNSYVAVLGGGFDIQYARYSNDRAPQYRIRTQIDKGQNGELTVSKYPLSVQAVAHVKTMKDAYEGLKKRYMGSGLKVCGCSLEYTGQEQSDGCFARFDFIKGVPLSALMDACLDKDDFEGFMNYFREFVRKTGYGEDNLVADADLAFSNIMVSYEEWTLIDYEWTFFKQIPARESAYRAIYCYLLEDPLRKKLPMDRVLAELGMTQEDALKYQEQEMVFQQYVTGNRRSMAQIREDIGYRVIQPQKWMEQYQDSEGVNRVQIYEDKGRGYSEEDSYFIPDAYQGENNIRFSISVSSDVKTIRIDPSMDSCMVKIMEISWNDKPLNLNKRGLLVINGRVFKSENGGLPSMVFATPDPNINIRLERLNRLEDNQLSVRMEVTRIPQSMAADLVKKKL